MLCLINFKIHKMTEFPTTYFSAGLAVIWTVKSCKKILSFGKGTQNL